MEQASTALAAMDYLTCEAACRQALAQARQNEQWDAYARILMPLQEARRQRRILAADGAIRLGTADLASPPEHWLEQIEVGCIVLTHPHAPADARALAEAAARHHRYIEVLFADNAPTDAPWRMQSYRGPAVVCQRPAPPESWTNRWLAAGETPQPHAAAASPADWFLDAAEALGDAALAQVHAPHGSTDRIDLLEQMLQVVTDHEQLHQQLTQAARARQHAPA